LSQAQAALYASLKSLSRDPEKRGLRNSHRWRSNWLRFAKWQNQLKRHQLGPADLVSEKYTFYAQSVNYPQWLWV
jgi:hypothetical protein